MILNEKYYAACDFAHNLSPSFFIDVVHDAFVEWFDKNHTNLFDEEESVVLRVVKKLYHKRYGHQRRMVPYSDKIKQVLVTPENELIEREMGLLFLTFEEISQKIEIYTQYHTMYPKINLN